MVEPLARSIIASFNINCLGHIRFVPVFLGSKPSTCTAIIRCWIISVENENCYCSLFLAGCISVDEDGNRLFLSDSNHHRIIIFDINAKILDSVCGCGCVCVYIYIFFDF